MLILTRKVGESVMIGETVKITILTVSKTKIKIGLSAPSDIPVHREEVYRKIAKSLHQGAHEVIIDLLSK